MSRFAPLKLSSMALLGLGLAVGGTAGSASAKEMKEESFKCPAGTYPDLKQKMPNCEALSPQGKPGPVSIVTPDAREHHNLPQAHGAKWRVSWKCPEGTSPNPTASMPNCLNHTGGGAAYSQRMQELDQREQQFVQREQQLLQREQELAQREEQYAMQYQQGQQQAQQQGEVTPALENMVTFKTSSAKLDQSAKATLSQLAKSLQGEQEMATIVIEGRADNTGSAEINQALSQKRAEAVRNYLEERGLNVAQIEVRPLGDASPVATNATQEGRQLNRSVAVVGVK